MEICEVYVDALEGEEKPTTSRDIRMLLSNARRTETRLYRLLQSTKESREIEQTREYLYSLNYRIQSDCRFYKYAICFPIVIPLPSSLHRPPIGEIISEGCVLCPTSRSHIPFLAPDPQTLHIDVFISTHELAIIPLDQPILSSLPLFQNLRKYRGARIPNHRTQFSVCLSASSDLPKSTPVLFRHFECSRQRLIEEISKVVFDEFKNRMTLERQARSLIIICYPCIV